MADDAPLSPEEVASPLPGLLSRARVVVTPYPFNVSGADFLRVVSVNSVPGVVIEVHGRCAVPGYDAAPFRFTHTPNSDRTVLTQDFVVGPGFVTNLTVFATGATPLISQTYVIIQLIRSAGATAFLMGTLVSGAVTTTQPLGWPGSPLVSSLEIEPAVREITGTDPPAGQACTETVPSGARWELLSCRVILVTAGAGADRRVSVVFSSGAVFFGTLMAQTAQPLSTSFTYTFAPNVAAFADTAAGAVQFGIMARALLHAGGSFGISHSNFNAGDNYQAPLYQVREWLEVP